MNGADLKETARLLRVELFQTRQELNKAERELEWKNQLVQEQRKEIRKLEDKIRSLDGWSEIAIGLVRSGGRLS